MGFGAGLGLGMGLGLGLDNGSPHLGMVVSVTTFPVYVRNQIGTLELVLVIHVLQQTLQDKNLADKIVKSSPTDILHSRKTVSLLSPKIPIKEEVLTFLFAYISSTFFLT